jgi:hypothetical protein
MFVQFFKCLLKKFDFLTNIEKLLEKNYILCMHLIMIFHIFFFSCEYMVMVFNFTFNNISVISWRSILLIK